MITAGENQTTAGATRQTYVNIHLELQLLSDRFYITKPLFIGWGILGNIVLFIKK